MNFDRTMDAWDWLDANGFQEEAENDYSHADGRQAHLYREPNDDGSKPAVVEIKTLTRIA